MAKIINGVSLPNIPWQDRPEGCSDVVWRYDANPIIKRNPAKNCQRVFNSAVVPWGDEFIGVFRADTTITTPNLHVGHSKDGINWEIDPEAHRANIRDEPSVEALATYAAPRGSLVASSEAALSRSATRRRARQSPRRPERT